MATPNQQDDCTKHRKINFTSILLKMGKLLAKIICKAFLALLQGLEALFSAEVVIVDAELVLAEAFIKNFVLFPLNATAATIKQTTDVVTKMTGYGFGPGCPSSDRVTKVVKQSKVGKFAALGRRLKTAADAAQASINDLQALADDLNKINDDINSLINGLCDKFN